MRITINARSEKELDKRVEDNEKRGWNLIKRSTRGGIYTTHWAIMERKDN